MFRIFPWLNGERPLYDEGGLKTLKRNHSYWRWKRIIDLIALVFSAVLICGFAAMVAEYFVNKEFHDFVIKTLEQNLVAIVLWGLTVLGIKFGTSDKA